MRRAARAVAVEDGITYLGRVDGDANGCGRGPFGIELVDGRTFSAGRLEACTCTASRSWMNCKVP